MSSPTWSDLNSPSIVPPLGARKAPVLENTGLMIACGPDFKLICSGTDKSFNRPFFNSTLVTLNTGDKGITVVGPFIGAPYAAMLMESMIAQGVKKVIFLGWCGAVSDQINVGDLVVPDHALVDEGTSCNYVQLDSDMPVVEPDHQLSDQLVDYMSGENLNCHRTCVWTTDAIYRETPTKVAHFRQKGASVVEMECSALFAVGQYRQVATAALMVVSDSVASKDWDPGFRSRQFKDARHHAVRMVKEFAKRLI